MWKPELQNSHHYGIYLLVDSGRQRNR